MIKKIIKPKPEWGEFSGDGVQSVFGDCLVNYDRFCEDLFCREFRDLQKRSK